jgi:hypothetical protein
VSRVWRPGETAVQRFVRADGSIGQHHPLRVIENDGERLLGWPTAATRTDFRPDPAWPAPALPPGLDVSVAD